MGFLVLALYLRVSSPNQLSRDHSNSDWTMLFCLQNHKVANKAKYIQDEIYCIPLKVFKDGAGAPVDYEMSFKDLWERVGAHYD